MISTKKYKKTSLALPQRAMTYDKKVRRNIIDEWFQSNQDNTFPDSTTRYILKEKAGCSLYQLDRALAYRRKPRENPCHFTALLRKQFSISKWPTKAEILMLSDATNKTPERIRQWFSCERFKEKKSQEKADFRNIDS